MAKKEDLTLCDNCGVKHSTVDGKCWGCKEPMVERKTKKRSKDRV